MNPSNIDLLSSFKYTPIKTQLETIRTIEVPNNIRLILFIEARLDLTGLPIK